MTGGRNPERQEDGFSHLPGPGRRGLHPAEPAADSSGGCTKCGRAHPIVLSSPKDGDLAPVQGLTERWG